LRINRRGFLKGLGGAGLFAWMLKPFRLFGFSRERKSIEARIDSALLKGFPPKERFFPGGMYGENSIGPPGETWNELIDYM
jgi:hypothetical protein